MLTLDQIKILASDSNMTDQEALEIRDQFYSLAEVIFEKWQKDREKEKVIRQQS